MKRLALLALLALPVAAQEAMDVAPCRMDGADCVPALSAFPAPAGCASGYVPYFDASLTLQCAPTVYAPSTNTTTVGTLAARNVTATALPASGAVTVTNQGTAGVTTYTYSVQACLPDGTCNAAGPASTTTTGHATLSATNLNRLSWSAVSGAALYKVRRDVGGATQGVIWSGTALTVDDTGLAGDSSAKPTVDGTGVVTADSVVANGSGIATTLLATASAVNATAATAGVTVQQSPAFRWEGHAWDSAPGNDDKWEWFAYHLPATAATTTTTWKLCVSKNGAAATCPFTIDNGGALTTLGAATLGGRVNGSGFITNTAGSSFLANLAANSAVWASDGAVFEGATQDTSELSISRPAYTDTTDGDVAATFAVGQGVAVTLGAGIAPKTGTLSGQALSQSGWISFTFDYTAISAAAHTKDLTLFTLPARSVVQYAICDTDTAATFADTLTLSVGDNSATYDNWLVDWDGKSDLLRGDADAERGTAIPDADVMAAYMPSFTATTAVILHADGNGTNLSGVSAGQWTCSVGFTVLP